MRLDHTLEQWIDLGILSEACITQVTTCGPEGAAVSFWVNIIDCPSSGGIISSRTYQNGGGFNFFCSGSNVR